MAERVACTGFWAAFRTATTCLEADLVAALAAGRLGRLIVDFCIDDIMGAGTAAAKPGDVQAMPDEGLL